jgi:hypothetical protein
VKLRVVIPLAASLAGFGEGRFTVTSIEFWSELVVVHWTLPGRMSQSRLEDLRNQRWSLRDHVETHYVDAGNSYGGWAQMTAGTAHFTPGCPVEAHKLWIAHGSLEHEVQIPG